MNAGDLLTPWLTLAAVLVPLVLVEKWIHSHLYGVGWLLTNDNRTATILYYVLLFPGVFVHEVVQWLVAGALRVETKRIRVWPEVQKDGTLRLDFVQIKPTHRINRAIIGTAPFLAGLALVWIISNHILNLDALLAALNARNLSQISAALRQLTRTPDFYLWLYLLFAISNAMLPTPADRQGWPLILGLLAAVILFLIVIGTGERLLQTYRESVLVGVERLTTAFATVLIVEIPAVLVIGFVEEVLERLTKRKFMYRNPVVAGRREPGSADPLPPGEPKPSIYRLELPVPLPPEQPLPRRVPAQPATALGARPPASPGTATLPPAPSTRPAVSPARPGSATAQHRVPSAPSAPDAAGASRIEPLAPARTRLTSEAESTGTSLQPQRAGPPPEQADRILASPAQRPAPLEPADGITAPRPLSPRPAAMDQDRTAPPGAIPPRSPIRAPAVPASDRAESDDEVRFRRPAASPAASDMPDEADAYLSDFRRFARRESAPSADQPTRPPAPFVSDAPARGATQPPRRPAFISDDDISQAAAEATEEVEYIPFDDVDPGDDEI